MMEQALIAGIVAHQTGAEQNSQQKAHDPDKLRALAGGQTPTLGWSGILSLGERQVRSGGRPSLEMANDRLGLLL
jgi:hypothetical protein